LNNASEHFNAVAPGGYEVGERLGGGGQAEVFAGHKQNQASWPLAIKIIEAPDHLTTELFTGEVNAMHALGEHPNVVKVQFAASFESRLTVAERTAGIRPQKYLFSVMDRALGNVADEMAYASRTEQGRLPTRVAIQYLLDMIAGVAHTHGERPDGTRQPGGIVHRDIKPANALLFRQDRPDLPLQVKLSDYGIARRGYDHPLSITQTHIGAGTVLYADPRQFYENGALFRHDQYMTAASGMHILTGIPPFKEFDGDQQALMHAHLHQPVPIRELRTPTGAVDILGEAVQQVVARAMSKSVMDRFGSMTEFGDTVTECVARTATKQAKNTQVIDTGGAKTWRLPLGDEAVEYVTSLSERYTIPATDSKKHLSRRGLLAGITSVAVGGTSMAWLLNRQDTPKGAPRPARSPEVPKTYEQRLAAAFSAKAPALPERSTAEKAAVRESVNQVVDIALEKLKAWGYVSQMIDVVGPLGQYDPDAGYALWLWMESQGYPNSKEVNGLSLADPHAWAAASLVDVKTDALTEVLLSEDWEDKTVEVGLATRANDVRAANRAVLGCALARLRPAKVASMDSYVGASTTARGLDDAVALALNPTSKNAATILHDLGLEEAPAAAPALAYKNPKVLMQELKQNKDMWNLNPRTFGWTLLNLLHNYPDFVQEMINTKTLDAITKDFIFTATMATSIRAAATHPKITEDIFRRRRSDMPKNVQLMYGLALAGYKPAVAEAVLSDQPNDTLLQLALDPTNATLRSKAMSELQNTLNYNPDKYTNISMLAASFICGQQLRL